MSINKKLVEKILSGKSDANIRFEDLKNLLVNLGFAVRIRGRHHIFIKKEIEEMINLQKEGHMAKPYQVRQVRAIITKYKLAEGGDN